MSRPARGDVAAAGSAQGSAPRASSVQASSATTPDPATERDAITTLSARETAARAVPALLDRAGPAS
jgi:hypothetical protein